MALSLLTTLFLAMPAQANLVLYVTDLEGSLARLEDFYATSGGFVKREGRWHLQAGITFVYGGDVPDRYFGSIEVIEELNRHFDENPGRVHHIAGNRDINKMRLTNELSDAALKLPPHYRDRVPPEVFRAESELPPDRARRLQYILRHTMGAPRAFEMMRAELASREGRIIDDARVVEAYLDLLKPGGALTALLGRMVLGVRFGRTLIVHGGVTRENLGEGSIDEWLSRLNAWYRAEFDEWVDGHMKWTGEGPRFGEELIEYPMPLVGAPSKPESVVTGRHVNLQNNPLPPHADVIEGLRARGIYREIVGHTPVADAAVTVRDEAQTFESIFADNSYSSREDNATWIWLSGEDFETAAIRGRAQTAPGVWSEVRAETTVGEPTRLGQLTADGARIIGFDAQNRGIATRMFDFQITSTFVACEESLM